MWKLNNRTKEQTKQNRNRVRYREQTGGQQRVWNGGGQTK